MTEQKIYFLYLIQIQNQCKIVHHEIRWICFPSVMMSVLSSPIPGLGARHQNFVIEIHFHQCDTIKATDETF